MKETAMDSLACQPFDSAPHRVMAYCHDSVGIGHLRRTLAISERIGAVYPNCSFLLATGTPYVPLFRPIPRVDYLKLPAMAKGADGRYGCKFLNITLSRLLRCRESILTRAAEYFDPEVLVVDKAPLGVCQELLPTLRWLRRHRPNTRIVFGMRDIEDSPEATIRQWRAAGVYRALDECFDEIWVYGMRDVFDPVVEYRLPRSIQAKLRFTGYVTRPMPRQPEAANADSSGVLVTVGGGTDGETLLKTYLDRTAARLGRAGIRSTVIGGPDLPESVADRLSRRAIKIPGVEWVPFEQNMHRRIRQARLVVCMGGYNTLCELITFRKTALVVPRVKPRLEQAIRAEQWARRGAIFSLHPSALTPDTLADRVVHLLNNGAAVADPDLDLGGLNRVADRFRAFWQKDVCNATAVCL